ncbi:MAG: acVLRF1 family peptidyl-tRNA hydrolase [Micromonosporaceae bacterium]
MRGRPAAGGGRWVEVDPERLGRWLDGFAERHGSIAVDPQQDRLVVAAFDGAVAELHPPPGSNGGRDIAEFVAAATQERVIGLLLARRGGAAVALAEGPRLVRSKVESAYVQGRTAAGGWSQQRFARRRANQARAAAEGVADVAARLLLPEAGRLAALVTGGDRGMVDIVLADRRLAPLAAKLSDRFLNVPDPRQATLPDALRRARAVHIRVLDPPP